MTVWDAVAATSRDAQHHATLVMARHLRHEHGWGRRRVARHLGVSEAWMRDYVDSEDGAA